MTDEKVSRVFQLIKKNKSLEEHFFRKLASTDNPFPWFKILKERGYLSPDKNPSPIEVPGKEGYYHIPYWNVLGYLENVASKNSRVQDEEIWKLLIETIDSIISCKDEKGQRIENNRTDWMLIKIIFKLPINRIKGEYIELIDLALRSKWDTTLIASEIRNTVIPYLIDNKARNLILELLNVTMSHKKTENILEFNSLMGDYWFHDALRNYTDAIAELCGVDAARIAVKKIEDVIEIDKRQFNQTIIPTIEDGPQILFPDRYECQLVLFVRKILEKVDPQNTRSFVIELIRKDHPIFKRIAIHTINCHYPKLEDLFWDWEGNPLEEPGLKHELYELLKAHCLSFSSEQIEKVLEWIEHEVLHFREEIRKDQTLVDRLTTYRKKEWLSAIMETKHPKVIAAYEKYSLTIPEEIEHPGFDVWYGSVKIIGEPEPFKKELLEKTNKEITDYLVQCKSEKERDENERSFRRSVRENPVKFARDLTPFLSVPREYQCALLTGLSEAWRSNIDLPWDELLNFAAQLVSDEEFWRERYENKFNYRNWIVGVIADLITDGTRDDRRAFDTTLLPLAESILFTLAQNAESDLADIGDLVTSVLNSARGKIFSAMMSYSLRYARVSKDEKGKRWAQKIKEYFTKGLDRTNEFSSAEFSLVLGQYLPYIYYLDDKWVIENINRIFPKDNEYHWKVAFTGYLFYSSHLSKDLYLLLRDNSHYSKALETLFDDRNSHERLIQHICVGYLYDLEDPDDDKSLIYQVLEKKNPDQLLKLVRFLWMLRDKLPAEQKVKIKPLWGRLFGTLSKEQNNPIYEETLSHLSLWLVLIDTLDERTSEWLKLSARHVQPVEEIFFIEYLLKHAEKTPDEVAAIYLEMLNNGIFPSSEQENIIKLVTVLYQQGKKQDADRICCLYLNMGYTFLRTLYEENR